MSLKGIARLAVAGLLATGAAVTIMAAPASAGPATMAAGCRFQLVSVTANELQESGGDDEIFLRIGDDTTRTVRFRERDSRGAAYFGSLDQTTEFFPAGGSITVRVIEADWPSADELLGSFNVYCVTGHFTKTVTGFGSNYEIEYDVVLVP